MVEFPLLHPQARAQMGRIFAPFKRRLRPGARCANAICALNAS
jgi:hypothetical protein